MLIHDILLLKHRGGWYWVVVSVVWVDEGCVVLFDPAIVAPRLAWLVEAVAFGGAADGDGGMWDGNSWAVYAYACTYTGVLSIRFDLIYFILLYSSILWIFLYPWLTWRTVPSFARWTFNLFLSGQPSSQNQFAYAHLFSWKSMVVACPSGMIRVFSGSSDIANVCMEGQR